MSLDIKDIDLEDDVFSGPITQRELIIIWWKRRQARLEREKAEAERKKLEEENPDNTKENEEPEKLTDRLEPQPATTLPVEEKNDAESDHLLPRLPDEVSNSAEPTDDSTSFATDSANQIDAGEATLPVILDQCEHPLQTSRIPGPDPTPAAGEAAEVAQPKPTRNILRPAKLNVDSASLPTDWVKRINMNTVHKPKRPAYVQPWHKS